MPLVVMLGFALLGLVLFLRPDAGKHWALKLSVGIANFSAQQRGGEPWLMPRMPEDRDFETVWAREGMRLVGLLLLGSAVAAAMVQG